MENMVKFGPTNVKRAINWVEGGKSEILQILISHQTYINSIQFVYVVGGKVLRSETHGKPNDLKLDVVTFDHPGEYLVSVSGQYYGDNLVSLAFGTKKRKYGPFGSNDNLKYYKPFVYNFTRKSSFGGFYGTVSVMNSVVCSIGVYINPIQSLAETETSIRSIKSEGH